MSDEVKYLLKLHKEGRISDSALDKALNEIETQPGTPDPKQNTAYENMLKRRRDKKKRKRQTDIIKKNHEHVMKELTHVVKNKTTELKLVDKPKCGYFKAYEISVKDYKDPQKLMKDKKSIVTNQINEDMKDLKALKFQLGLTVEFFKDDGEIKKYTTGVLHGDQNAILNSDKVTELYDQSSAIIQTKIENFTNTASGLEIDHCIKLYLNIAKYEPLKGSSYIPLPKILANKKAIINVKNKDNKCVLYAINSALNPADNHVDRLSSYSSIDYLKKNGIDFPTPISQIPKLEKQNNLAINVYGYNLTKTEQLTIFPYHISDQPKDIKRINLLLICEDVTVKDEPKTTNYHYCWIKQLNRLLYDQNKHHGQTYFCDRCLYGFSREDLLTKHREDCDGINKNPMKIEMPKDKNITFKNYQNQMPVPFVIYADFESIIEPQTIKCGDKSEIQNIHKACGFGYQVVRYDGVANQPIIYRGEDTVDEFLKRLTQERRVINDTFKNPQPLIMTEEDNEAFGTSTHCWICEKEIDKKGKNYKVKDHCHFTGKYRGAAHKECNLKLKIKPYTTAIPVVFHNLKGYDSHLIMQKIHKSYGNITCIANNAEKYISFSIGQLKFLDSFQFMSSSLAKLVENTPDLKITKETFGNEHLNKELYKVGKFQSENNRNITLRETIDRSKLKYILSNPDMFDLGSRFIKGKKLDQDSQITLLKEYLNRTNKRGECIMSYYQRNGFGRYWTSEKLGLQNMSRKIRHTLCRDTMIDIDMKNAHPTLLSSYCHNNNIPCEGLDLYINNREELMKQYMELNKVSRDDAKKDLLAIINGREVNIKQEDPEWFGEYYNGMRTIIDSVCLLNPDLYELAEKQKLQKRTTYNIKGSAVNLLMCKLENEALMAAFDYLNEKEIEVSSLVFDGLMIYMNDAININDILVGCSNAVKNKIDCDITFTVKEMVEGYDIQVETSSNNQDVELLRKGVYPYEYIDDFDKFNETELPPKECFYSSLTDGHISNKDYQHAQNVWKQFNCKTLGDYHDLYLKTDVTLLADVFQTFRKTCMQSYKLDPLHYYTAPGLSWDALLKYTNMNLELLSDIDMHLFIEKGMRGGISMVSKRHAKANNPHVADYDPTKEHNYIMYYDANNLYGHAMSQPLPYSGFKWVTSKDMLETKQGKGYIYEVDLEYPKELHKLHNDYPLAPEKLSVKTEWLSEYQTELLQNNSMINVQKLVPNLMNKEKYVVHYKTLQLYESLGMKIKKIHRILEFNEKPWMEPYIRLNTEFRKKAKSAFEKDFYKLMNNSVFGKTMENIRKRVDIKIVRTEGSENEKIRKIIAKPNFNRRVKFSDDLSAIHVNKTKLTLNKPIYVGMSVLDLSKHLMYDWYYNTLKKKYGDKCNLLYTDTDSLLVDIKTEDVYKDMDNMKNEYDFSDYPKDHQLFDETNKKVIGKMKDECASTPISEYIGLRPKLYSILRADEQLIKKAKGVKKYVIKKHINFENYKDALFNKTKYTHEMNMIRSQKHQIYGLKINKTTLSPLDTKRYIAPDGITTYAFGYQPEQ